MVKILGSFNDVETQNLLSPKGEPHAIHCSNDCLFMALDNCLVEIYKANTVQLIAQVRTVGPVVKLIYNKPWDCIVTLERKHAESHNFVRVYFNWRASSTERPVRIGHLESPHDSDATSPSASAEIVELPVEDDRHVKCLASCERTGVIAVGTDGLLRLFSIRMTATARVISTLCDISLEMNVLKVAIFCDYLACISSCEVRVLKICWYGGDDRHGLKNYAPDHLLARPRRHPSGPKGPPLTSPDIGLDSTFIEWSPRCVRDAQGNVSVTMERHPAPPTSHTSVGLLNLRSVSKAMAEKEGSSYQSEVLGPVENIGGQQVEIEASSAESGERIMCHVVTMLYRRFVPKAEVTASSDPRSKTLTTTGAELSTNKRASDAKGKTATLPPGGEQRSKVAPSLPEHVQDAPHTVELLPTLAEGK